jgi:hypothetical protein
MAGKFVTIVNPGYSTLFTRDLTAVGNDNVRAASASANLFDPDYTNPLQEGEWLSINSSNKFVRPAVGDVTGGSNSSGILEILADAHNAASTFSCFMYFQERGRYDAQVTRKAHCIVGPAGFEFRTKQIVCAASDEGERVFVYICIDASGRKVSALVSASAAHAASVVTPALSTAGPVVNGSWYAGVITRIHGTNDATVLFQPGNL